MTIYSQKKSDNNTASSTWCVEKQQQTTIKASRENFTTARQTDRQTTGASDHTQSVDKSWTIIMGHLTRVASAEYKVSNTYRARKFRLRPQTESASALASCIEQCRSLSLFISALYTVTHTPMYTSQGYIVTHTVIHLFYIRHFHKHHTRTHARARLVHLVRY